MNTTRKRPGIGVLVLIGFTLGIAVGLFFGEMATVLGAVGRAYVRLLQMAVIPYITVSLIAGLGRLTPQQARRIAASGGLILILILTAGMTLVLLAPLGYPDWEAATYFSSELLNEGSDVDFLSLYIPANPFSALANTVVPAVVLFSIIMGVAVMQSKSKKMILDLLGAFDEALMIVTRYMVMLAPLGIFAISANAAGTLDVTALGKLQVYVWCFLLLWAILFFWLLPGLVCALTPIRYGEIFAEFRVVLLTAFATGSLLVVLPMLVQGIRELLEKHQIADAESDAAVEVLIPTTFNFPSVAMLLVLSFVLFAGWFAGSPISLGNYPTFSAVGLFVAFGGSNIALPFLLDMFRLPADLFQLFLVANVITNSFFMALSAMNLVTLTLVTVFMIKRKLSLRPAMLLVLIGGTAIGAPTLLATAATTIESLVPYEYTSYTEFVDGKLLAVPVPVRQEEQMQTVPPEGSRLQAITRRGSLRLGYSANALPWVFRNRDSEIVGFDMELAHGIAGDLGVELELVQLPAQEIAAGLTSGRIDIYMSGLLVSPELVKDLTLSDPYLEVTLGFLTPDHRRDEFSSVESLRRRGPWKLGVLTAATVERALQIGLPGSTLRGIESPRDYLRGELPELDAVIMSAEAGSAWTLVYPEYAVVVPKPLLVRMPVAMALPSGDTRLQNFVNSWISLNSSLGTVDRAFDYWILGREAQQRLQPRWSVIRDVLHWVD